MTRLLAFAFAVFLAIAAAPVSGSVLCPACVDHSRDNSRCEWVGDTDFVIDLQNPTHHRHLVQDAQLAEELAVRFADAEHGRLFGTAHHGGLIDNGRVVRDCQARMFAQIETSHSVPADEIQRARAERSAWFDATVRLLFLPFYVLAVTVACRTIARRFHDDRRATLVAAVLASAVVALLGSYLLVLWSMPWEAIRVGNGHIGGYRLATLNRHGAGAVFAAAALAFWTIAALQRWLSVTAVVGAAAFSCAVLAAMFVRTFATGAAAYVITSVVLLIVVFGLWQAGRLAAMATRQAMGTRVFISNF